MDQPDIELVIQTMIFPDCVHAYFVGALAAAADQRGTASTVAHNSTLRPALNFSCVTGFILLLRGKLLTVLSLQPQPPSSPSSRSGVAGSGAN